ncbi:hypothetical protein C0J52_13974 [Blattella germanica]|nr:hypothetical protein C0J52_13974 [Blattella germanica]
MLGVFEREVLRRIFGVVFENNVWRMRNNHELYEKYKSTNMITHIKLRRLEWAGHVYRMEEHRTPRRIMEGRLYGVRSIGRPKDRWTDAVTADSKELLGTVAWRRAMDRKGCRKIVEKARAESRAVTPV